MADTEHNEDTKYVNLLENPERYTGYSGDAAHRIWNSIYKENCFECAINLSIIVLLSDSSRTADHRTGLLTHDELLGMCIEKRSFYRAISGLHASINMHVSSIYPTISTFPVAETHWGPSYERFKHYFSPETTDGQGNREQSPCLSSLIYT